MRILIVKLTSMGDLIQALPAISEFHRHFPDARIDWAIDTNFAEIAAWHPAIGGIYPTNHRKWSKRPFSISIWREIFGLIKKIRRKPYDYAIDLQTNFKSAFITRLARARRVGPAKGCTVEPLIHHFYQQHFQVNRNQLAIYRWQILLSSLFGYTCNTQQLDFGLSDQTWRKSPRQPDEPYLVFITNASWPNKRLPLSTWVALAGFAAQAGLRVLLPWGTGKERALASELAERTTNATLLPRLGLTELASLLFHARGALCNDTGLAHLSAALGRPTVTAYGPTDPGLIAATGPRAEQLRVDDYPCLACYRRGCAQNPRNRAQAKCLEGLGADLLWKSLVARIG